jgi:hypothetical protein
MATAADRGTARPGKVHRPILDWQATSPCRSSASAYSSSGRIAAAQKEESEKRRLAADKAQKLATLRAQAYKEEQEELAAAAIST